MTNKRTKEKIKRKDKLIEIKVPILNDEYFVYILMGSKKRAYSWLLSYYGDSNLSLADFEGFYSKTFYHRDYAPVIYLISQKYKYTALAHEAVHAINYIWKDIGEDSKDEVFAHSVGAIVRAVEKRKR